VAVACGCVQAYLLLVRVELPAVVDDASVGQGRQQHALPEGDEHHSLDAQELEEGVEGLDRLVDAVVQPHQRVQRHHLAAVDDDRRPHVHVAELPHTLLVVAALLGDHSH
jgi:hypothetical protein